MKTPSGTSIVIVLALIATVSVVIFQACATESGGTPRDGKKFKFILTIGKSPSEYVEFKDEKNAKPRFDEVLGRLEHKTQYEIRYKRDPKTEAVEDYTPPRNVSLKTDKVTTSALAKNAPPGDPHVTQRVSSNSAEDIKNVLDTLK
jgi:hypothetical protein